MSNRAFDRRHIHLISHYSNYSVNKVMKNTWDKTFYFSYFETGLAPTLHTYQSILNCKNTVMCAEKKVKQTKERISANYLFT